MKSVPFFGGGGFGSGGLRGQEVFNWLHRLNLTHHFDKFLSAGVEELGVVRQLGEEQLLSLGISDVHERLSLLQAIRILHVPIRRGPGGPGGVGSLLKGTSASSISRGPPGDIELSVFKCRDGFFYNNNGYHDPSVGGEEEGDYSECAEFDLSGGGCSGSGGGCSCGSGGDEDPFYESVGGNLGRPSQETNLRSLPPTSGGVYNRAPSLHPTLLRSLIKEKVIQDRVDLSRIEDESVLRGVAAKYASDLAASLLPPTGGPGGGGGTSFSSSSSSSSGYPPSLPPDLHPHVLHALRHLRAHPSPYRRPGRRPPEESRPIYTPGVYQPSSCLRDEEEIYDYIPPRGTLPVFLDLHEETHHTPIYSSRSATLGRLSVSTPRLRTPKKGGSSRGGQAPSSYGFIRSTPKRTPGPGVTSLSMSSYTISGSCSSSATSPSSTSNNAYGFVSPPFVGEEVFPPGNKGEGGCRTLLRIGRRLGLSRILRSLRLSGGGEEFNAPLSQSAPPSTLRRFQSVPPTSLALEVPSNATPTHALTSQSDPASSSPVEGLPSNERIIETINRLKFKELQRRKERIAHEHRAMSKNRSSEHEGSGSDDLSVAQASSSQEAGRRGGDLLETYEDPVDSQRDSPGGMPLTPSARRTPLPPQGRQRGSAASTNSSHESFSETFARHLRSRHSASSSHIKTTSPHDDANLPSHLPHVSESKQNVENVTLEEEEDACPSVVDFLSRHSLQAYADLLEKEGFETLELLMDIEEEDLLRLSIADPEHRGRLLAAAHSLRPSPQRPPCQTSYQWDYYATSARKGRGIVAVEVHTAGRDSGVFVGKEEELVLSPVTLPHPPPFKAFFPCEKSSDSGVSMSTSSPPPTHRTH